MLGGGGSAAGEIKFPVHMEDTQKDWLGHTTTSGDTIDTSIVDVMNTALGVGGNPWENITITDPSSSFADVQTRYDSLETDVDALDHKVDWARAITKAVEEVDTAGVLENVDFSSVVTAAQAESNTSLQKAVEAANEVLDTDIIDDIVEEFERRASKQRNRSINRFSSTMADINAVQSSAFIFGMAMIEAEHLQSVDQFQSELNLQLLRQGVENYARMYMEDIKDRFRAEVINKSSREELLKEGTRIMVQLLTNNVRLKHGSTELLSDIKRIEVVGTQEYELADAELDYKFARWDFEAFQNGMYVLGGISGPAGSFPDRPSKVSSAIGGALSGAARGALAGSAAPGIGTVAGGIIGAGLGIGQALLR